MDDFIEIQLGSSFLLNAGICGFIRFLEYNKATEGVDYIIENQSLSVSKKYFLDNDISGMYVKTMSGILGEQSKFNEILNKYASQNCLCFTKLLFALNFKSNHIGM